MIAISSFVLVVLSLDTSELISTNVVLKVFFKIALSWRVTSVLLIAIFFGRMFCFFNSCARNLRSGFFSFGYLTLIDLCCAPLASI